ncbi:MAG TPA: ABC transporter permease subunit [Acidimicrobiales bacterium]|nr:ABC transporter permease subunit [Acidimicrobiales bacterium]
MARRRRPWEAVSVGLGAGLAGLAMVGVVGFLVAGVRSGPVSWVELVTSPVWDPPSGQFGATAMIWGTAVVAALALALAAPVGWAAAIAIHEVAPVRWRRRLRTGCELLAVVPSIVYGLLGVAFLRPLVSDVAGVPGGDSLLTAGLVLAVMVLPTVVAVSVDALAGVSVATREAAAACGLRRSEVIRSAVVPEARRGMGAGALLGLARALGETIAVYLVVGRADGLVPSGVSDAVTRVVHPGQTLTTKLNGPETVLAGTSGSHWAALCALGLLLLAVVAAVTVVGQRHARHPQRRSMYSRVLREGVRGARRGRSARDVISRAALAGVLAVPLALVAGIAVVALTKGRVVLHPGFWSTSALGASGGGIRGQLAGTLLLVAIAGLLAAPSGLAIGLLIAEYAGPRTARRLQTLTLTLGGVPSILLGLWGYWLFSSRLGWGKSWLAGAVALSVIAVPPVALAVAATIAALPGDRREAALAVGLRRDQIVRSVLVPHAIPGLVTGLLLGLARAAGETAPLLFTATVFSGAPTLPTGIRNSPVTSLPTHIFSLAQDTADPAALRTAWGAAVVLMAVAGLLALLAVPVRRRVEARTA